MKRAILIVALASSLAACSQAQSDKFQASLLRFEANVEAIDRTISRVSPTLAKHCTTLQSVGQSLAGIVNTATTNTSAIGGLDAANAALRTFCQAPPTDIATAVATVAAQVAAARAAYKAARAVG